MGAIIEAQVDNMLGDLELLFQEQLAVLVEDIAELLNEFPEISKGLQFVHPVTGEIMRIEDDGSSRCVKRVNV